MPEWFIDSEIKALEELEEEIGKNAGKRPKTGKSDNFGETDS